MTSNQLDRLEQLAAHIISPQRRHKEFDLARFNRGLPSGQTNVCGTHGCALGELPALWPEQFKWVGGGVGFLDSGCGESIAILCENYFGMDQYEAWLLFSPVHMDEDLFKGAYILMLEVMEETGVQALERDATAEEAAANIRQFVRAKRGTLKV